MSVQGFQRISKKEKRKKKNKQRNKKTLGLGNIFASCKQVPCSPVYARRKNFRRTRVFIRGLVLSFVPILILVVDNDQYKLVFDAGFVQITVFYRNKIYIIYKNQVRSVEYKKQGQNHY